MNRKNKVTMMAMMTDRGEDRGAGQKDRPVSPLESVSSEKEVCVVLFIFRISTHTFTLLVLCCNAMQKREKKRVRVECKHFQSIECKRRRAPRSGW